jgi:hypothetical protein
LREKRDVDVDGIESADNPNDGGAAVVGFEFRRPKGRREDFGDERSDSAPSSVRAAECDPGFIVLISSGSSKVKGEMVSFTM